MLVFRNSFSFSEPNYSYNQQSLTTINRSKTMTKMTWIILHLYLERKQKKIVPFYFFVPNLCFRKSGNEKRTFSCMCVSFFLSESIRSSLSHFDKLFFLLNYKSQLIPNDLNLLFFCYFLGSYFSNNDDTLEI